MVYNKLVRDRIPSIIRESGRIPVTHTANDTEYRTLLLEKLVEEASEFRENTSEEEFADVLEVHAAVKKCLGFNESELERVGTRKRQERGGFDQRIILEEVAG